LTTEQKQQAKNSPVGPMQKIVCECGKIYTRKNKSQHEKSMYYQQFIVNDDQKYSKRQEKKQE
jgi:hypothetical protein